MCTIIHFSDVHLPFPPGALRTSHIWHPKRLTALINFALRRSGKYAEGEQKLSAFRSFLRENPVDYLFYTGDSTNLGLEAEFIVTTPKIRETLQQATKGYLLTPGNHDIYLNDSHRYFRRYVAPWCQSDLPKFRTETGFPLVKWIGDHAVAISLNTAKPNPLIWKSSGRFQIPELNALQQILERKEIRERRHIFLLTHFALAEHDPFHGLENAGALFDLIRDRADMSLLHGHNHRLYVQQLAGLRPRLYCAGSLTKKGAESFLHYEWNGSDFSVKRGIWKNAAFHLGILDPTEYIHPRPVMS